MKRTIIINESQLHLIREFESNEVMHDDFKDAVLVYLKELHKNPTHPQLNNFFKENNISEVELQNKMMNLGLISKKEKIHEPKDASGKKRSMHSISYQFYNKNYDKNIDKLYDSFFKNGKRKSLNEEGEAGGFAGGALGGCGLNVGTSDSSGGITYPFGSVQRRGKYNSQRKKTGDVTKQDSNVDMTPALDRTPGFSTKRKK